MLMQNELKHQLFEACDALFPKLLQALQQVASIPSVEGEVSDGAPFGCMVKQALDTTLSISEELGFHVESDGYVGFAQLGEETDYIAALGHLDVVPEGKGWVHPPYGATIDEVDHRIYGRGVLDNKGPILACLYAMKAIADVLPQPKHAIRILFGTNEETGFHDIPQYLKYHRPPLAGFTPDCKYPVVYGERGRLKLRLLYTGNEQEQFFTFLNETFLSGDHTGKELHIDCHDQEFGVLQMGGFRMIQEKRYPGFDFSIQYPACQDDETLTRIIEEQLPLDVHVSVLLHYPPVRFAKDSTLIKTLQYAYETVTGQDGTPVTTTGGTYAKVMPNIVPFGPSFPGQKGIAHLPDEWINLDDLKSNMKIYALALAELSNMAEF